MNVMDKLKKLPITFCYLKISIIGKNNNKSINKTGNIKQ